MTRPPTSSGRASFFEAAGATHPAARVSARVAEITWERGRLEQGLESIDSAFALLSQEEPDADLASLAAQIGRFMHFAGQGHLALERLERALEIAELLSLPETLAQALNTKGVVLFARGRKTEGLALLRKGLEIALEHDKPSAALRAYYNLADLTVQIDRAPESAQLAEDGLALARRLGNRYWEWSFLGFAYPLWALGDWDQVVAREDSLPEEDWTGARLAFGTFLTPVVPVRVNRGQLQEAKRSTRLFAELEASADLQEQAQVHFAQATLLLAEGKYAEALRSAEASLETRHAVGISFEAVKESFVVAVEAAFALDDVSRAEELLALVETLPPGASPQFLQAHSARFRARLAARQAAREEPDRLFKRAGGLFRKLALPFYLAVTLLEHGEWLQAQDRRQDSEPLLVEAREIFERLDAKPWLERMGQTALVEPEPEAATAGS
jgi:tetratricopeptide (TPR) repeat protein